MATQERVYTVDDVWRLEQQPLNPADKYYLIDGEMLIKMAPGYAHARLATRIARFLDEYAEAHGLGATLVEPGHYPSPERRTVLLPDVSFVRTDRLPEPAFSRYLPYMPDLAVEIISPSQSLAQTRRKAEVYLRHGAALVWLVDPAAKFAEAWRRGADGALASERIAAEDELNGGDILPGFQLPLARIFTN